MAKQKSSEIFARNLEILRRKNGLSQEQLADKVGLTRQAIYKYEKAETNPSMDVVSKLANVFEESLDYFMTPRNEFDAFSETIRILGRSFTKANYRAKYNLEEETDLSVKKEAFDRFSKLIEIEDLTKQKVKFSNPVKKLLIKDKHGAEKAALEVRKKWGLYDNPIANVVALLEGKGVRVIEVRASDSFQGLSAMYDDIPFIVLNISIEEVTRRRFTALHELGHLLLQLCEKLTDNAVERVCDAFAATMLLPKELLVRELGDNRTRLSQRELDKIKSKYGISIQAILVGAALSGIITWERYHESKQEEYGVNSIKYEVDERACRFEHLLWLGLAEGLIDRVKAEELVNGSEVSSVLDLEEEFV